MSSLRFLTQPRQTTGSPPAVSQTMSEPDPIACFTRASLKPHPLAASGIEANSGTPRQNGHHGEPGISTRIRFHFSRVISIRRLITTAYRLGTCTGLPSIHAARTCKLALPGETPFGRRKSTRYVSVVPGMPI